MGSQGNVNFMCLRMLEFGVSRFCLLMVTAQCHSSLGQGNDSPSCGFTVLLDWQELQSLSLLSASYAQALGLFPSGPKGTDLPKGAGIISQRTLGTLWKKSHIICSYSAHREHFKKRM